MYFEEYISKYGMEALLSALKLTLFKCGRKMIDESELSSMEKKVVTFLESNLESKLKDFFLADLSWANNEKQRNQAFIDFFTKRVGKRIIDILPNDIRIYIIMNSL